MADSMFRKNKKFLALTLVILLFVSGITYLDNSGTVVKKDSSSVAETLNYNTGSNDSSLKAPTPPPTPTNLHLRFTDNGGVCLTWDQPYSAGSDIVGYKVYRREAIRDWGDYKANTGDWIPIGTINNHTYTDYSISEGTGYDYAVSSLSPGAESPLSSWVHIVTPSEIGPEPYPWWFALSLVLIGVAIVYRAYRLPERRTAEKPGAYDYIEPDNLFTLKLMRRSRIGGILGIIMLLNSIPGIWIFSWFIVAHHSSSYGEALFIFILLPMTIVQAAAGSLLFRNGKDIQNDIRRNHLSRARSRVQICIVWGAIAIVSSLFNPILFAIITESAGAMVLGVFSVLIPVAPTVLFSMIYPDFIREPIPEPETEREEKKTDTPHLTVFETGAKERFWNFWFASGIVGSSFIIIGAVMLIFFWLIISPYFNGYVDRNILYIFISSTFVAVGLLFKSIDFIGYHLRYKKKLLFIIGIVGILCSFIYLWLVVASVEIRYVNRNNIFGSVIVSRDYWLNSSFHYANLLIGFFFLLIGFAVMKFYRLEGRSLRNKKALTTVLSFLLAGIVFIVSAGSPASWFFAILAEIMAAIFFYKTPRKAEKEIGTDRPTPPEEENELHEP